MNRNDLKNLFRMSKSYEKKRSRIKKRVSNRNDSPISRIIFPGYILNSKDITIAAQKWMYNGFLIVNQGHKFCIDPGIDFLTRCSLSNIDLTDTDALFISHAHIDHYASANVVSEQINLSGTLSKAQFLLPKTVVNNRVISDYHLGLEEGSTGPEIQILEEGKQIKLPIGTVEPVEAWHSIADSFGFVLRMVGKTIGYTGDTGYAQKLLLGNEVVEVDNLNEPIYENLKLVQKREKIKSVFGRCDILIVNVNSLEYNRHSRTHLSIFDVLDILLESKIKTLILSHVNIHPLVDKGYWEKVRKFVQRKSGVKTYLITGKGLALSI